MVGHRACPGRVSRQPGDLVRRAQAVRGLRPGPGAALQPVQRAGLHTAAGHHDRGADHAAAGDQRPGHQRGAAQAGSRTVGHGGRGRPDQRDLHHRRCRDPGPGCGRRQCLRQGVRQLPADGSDQQPDTGRGAVAGPDPVDRQADQAAACNVRHRVGADRAGQPAGRAQRAAHPDAGQQLRRNRRPDPGHARPAAGGRRARPSRPRMGCSACWPA